MDLNFSGITPHFNSHDLKLYKNSRVTPFIKADMLDLLLHMFLNKSFILPFSKFYTYSMMLFIEVLNSEYFIFSRLTNGRKL